MKQTVMDLNDPAEPTVFVNSVVEHYTPYYYFGGIPADTYPNQNVDKLSKINNCKVIPLLVKLYIMYIMLIQILD